MIDNITNSQGRAKSTHLCREVICLWHWRIKYTCLQYGYLISRKPRQAIWIDHFPILQVEKVFCSPALFSGLRVTWDVFALKANRKIPVFLFQVRSLFRLPVQYLLYPLVGNPPVCFPILLLWGYSTKWYCTQTWIILLISLKIMRPFCYCELLMLMKEFLHYKHHCQFGHNTFNKKNASELVVKGTKLILKCLNIKIVEKT